MSHLHTLLLNDLTLSDPPDPIPSLGTQAILSYLHYKHKSSQAITSLRVVLVGPESVGKTSLVARLKGDPIDGINPTKGLEVREKEDNKSLIFIFCLHVHTCTCTMYFKTLFY